MPNLKNITELPVAESAEGLNLIVNDNGAAKQIAASAVGAQADFAVTDENSPAYIKNKPEVVQADWAETDENSPAFVRNKPVEEWDLDVSITTILDPEGNWSHEYVITNKKSFEEIKNKIVNGIPLNNKVISSRLVSSDAAPSFPKCNVWYCYYSIGSDGEDSPEHICFEIECDGYCVCLLLFPDGTVEDDT